MLLLYVCLCVGFVHMNAGALTGQQRVTAAPSVVELQMVVPPCMDTGN